MWGGVTIRDKSRKTWEMFSIVRIGGCFWNSGDPDEGTRPSPHFRGESGGLEGCAGVQDPGVRETSEPRNVTKKAAGRRSSVEMTVWYLGTKLVPGRRPNAWGQQGHPTPYLGYRDFMAEWWGLALGKQLQSKLWFGTEEQLHKTSSPSYTASNRGSPHWPTWQFQ